MPLWDRVCASCGRSYALLARGWDKKLKVFREVSAMDHDDPDHLTCPDCHCSTWNYPHGYRTAPTTDSTMYPYFDYGLGMLLQSAQHRRRVMKERNLIPLEGEMQTFQDMGEREMSSRKDLDAYLAEESRKQQDDPEIRKANDVIKQMAERKELHTLFKGTDRKAVRVGSSY